jgi:hypothetical protein
MKRIAPTPLRPFRPAPNLTGASGGGEPGGPCADARQIPSDREDNLGKYVLAGFLHTHDGLRYYALESEMDVTVATSRDRTDSGQPSTERFRSAAGRHSVGAVPPAVRQARRHSPNFLVPPCGRRGTQRQKLTIQWRVASPDLDRRGRDYGNAHAAPWFGGFQIFHA